MPWRGRVRYPPIRTVKSPNTIKPPCAVASRIRAAGKPLTRTVKDPITITSGGPTHVNMSEIRAWGRHPVSTVIAQGGRMGPPTCGTSTVSIGQMCMSVARAAGIPAPGDAEKLPWALDAAASKDFLALAEAAACFAFWSSAFLSWVFGFSGAIFLPNFRSCPESIAQFVLPTQARNRWGCSADTSVSHPKTAANHAVDRALETLETGPGSTHR